jgi:sugar fermentation stimulation protein A
MFYLIQREDCKSFSLAKDIDSKYHEAFLKAKKAGVEAIAYKCNLTTEEIKVTEKVEIL